MNVFFFSCDWRMLKLLSSDFFNMTVEEISAIEEQNSISGYSDEARRVLELCVQSIIQEESSGESEVDDESVATSVQLNSMKNIMRERSEKTNRIQNQIVTHKKCDEHCKYDSDIMMLANKLYDLGVIVFKASDISLSRKALRSCSGIVEVLPGWFVIGNKISNMNDIQRIKTFLRKKIGYAKFEHFMQTYTAQPVLPNVDCSPMWQNMKHEAFLALVLAFTALNNGCRVNEDIKQFCKVIPDKLCSLLYDGKLSK